MMSKPSITANTAKKAPAKKPAFFSDSDDEDDFKPKAKPVAKPVPVQTQANANRVSVK